jgi:hypothetical protein
MVSLTKARMGRLILFGLSCPLGLFCSDCFGISQKSRENNSIQCDEYYNKYKDKQIGLIKFNFEDIEIQQFIRLYRFHRLNNVVVFLKDF